MDVPTLHRRACEEFGRRVRAVGDDQWDLPTPCAEWDVRDLVNHIVYENRWTPPLFEGRTVAEIGDRFEGDLLGDDPHGAWDDAVRAAMEAVQAEGAMGRTIHLSFGDFPGEFYAMQLFADHLVHAWDLARAIGADERLDPELVEACRSWFESMESSYREGGAVGPRADVPEDADAQSQLLAMFGRQA